MNNSWRFSDTKSLREKVVIVTGGNSGLGYESVKMFASKDATVILASRSLEKGLQAKAKILSEIQNSNIHVMILNLGNLESIKHFANEFTKNYSRLDILLNNAGIMNTPFGLTSDGFEQQIGVNHFGHFSLTGLLFNTLKNTPSSRIVNISSLMHKKGSINLDDLFFKTANNYTPQTAYAQSKLANLLFTYQLKKNIEENNLDMKVLAAHPGGASTNLGRYSKDTFLQKLLKKQYIHY